MGFSDTIEFRLEPKVIDDQLPYDIDKKNTVDNLSTNARCAIDPEANSAHTAVFDAESEHILADDDENKSRIWIELRDKLRPAAAIYCGKCAVADTCGQIGLERTYLDYGVNGGMSGDGRRRLAVKYGITQPSMRKPR